ncbi:MAG: GNAT family N-acetyltransferase, partial [Bacilli bacterium]
RPAFCTLLFFCGESAVSFFSGLYGERAMNVEKMAAILGEALANDPLFLHVFPGEARRQQLEALFRFLIARNIRTGGTILTDEATYVALLDTGKKASLLTEMSNLRDMIALSVRLPFRSLQLLTRYEKIVRYNAPTEAHVYVTVLGVLPEVQGKGIGRKVLNEIHEIAGEEAVVALDTENERNVGYYEQFSYRVHAVADLDGVGVFCMKRKRDWLSSY